MLDWRVFLLSSSKKGIGRKDPMSLDKTFDVGWVKNTLKEKPKKKSVPTSLHLNVKDESLYYEVIGKKPKNRIEGQIPLTLIWIDYIEEEKTFCIVGPDRVVGLVHVSEDVPMWLTSLKSHLQKVYQLLKGVFFRQLDLIR